MDIPKSAELLDKAEGTSKVNGKYIHVALYRAYLSQGFKSGYKQKETYFASLRIGDEIGIIKATGRNIGSLKGRYRKVKASIDRRR